MNIAYFRKSAFNLDKTIQNLLEHAVKTNWNVLGTVNLPDNSGKMILICRPEWVKTVIKSDYNMLGFLPCSVSIFQKGNEVLIGTGQPAVIKAVSRDPNIQKIANLAEKEIKDLIHASAGIDELKPKNVKLYSTMSCPYCKMEKEWLEKNKIKHEVLYVDLNPHEAQKMVEKTGQMGVPVTEIEYEGNESEYVIGFDQAKLASSLGVQ